MAGPSEPATNDEIYIVDDDCATREALSVVFRDAGFRTAAFSDAQSFVRLARDLAPACVLLNLFLPGESGFDVLRDIDAKSYPAPIVIFSACSEIGQVVAAMRNGAFDYLEKRLDMAAIGARVLDAIGEWRQLRRSEETRPAVLSPIHGAIRGYYQLTRREREVLALIVAAASNKEAARTLGISPRTVEIHRGRIMQKLGAKNSIDLIRIIMNGGRETGRLFGGAGVPLASSA